MARLLFLLAAIVLSATSADEDEVIIKWNVRSSVQDFWNVVSNWEDSSWVKGTNGVTVDPKDRTIRTLHFVEPRVMDLVVKRHEYEPEKLRFVYGWENQSGFKKYRGHVSLEPFGNEVLVTYRAVFSPSDDSKRQAIKDGFINQFQNGRVPWLQEKFQRPRPITGLLWVTLSSSAIIDAPVDDVWKVQSPFAKMTEWYKQFDDIKIVSSGEANQVGAARECYVKGGKIVRETLVSMEPENYTYSYHFIGYTDPKDSPFGALTLDNHRALVTLAPVTINSEKDATLVRWNINFYTHPESVETAKAANEYTFKALFDQLGKYFENKKATSKTALKLNKHGGLRQAALLPETVTLSRAWTTMHNRDLSDTEPLYSTFLGAEGKHRRSFHGKYEGKHENTKADHRNFVDTFSGSFGKGTMISGSRTVVKIVHGPYANRVAIIFNDTATNITEEHLSSFAKDYTNYVAKHSVIKLNPCCAIPCQNGGVCTWANGAKYTCDCPDGWYGENCTSPTWSQWISDSLTPSVECEEAIRGNSFLMGIINSVDWLSSTFMKFAVRSKLRKPIVPAPFATSHGYRTADGLLNISYYSRLLPEVPANCPTPAGVVGPAEYPPSDIIVEKFLARKKFKESSVYTSLLLAIYGQHFTHQFFKTAEGLGGEGLTITDHYIDMNNIYGENIETQHMLREHKGGRMKMQVIDGEDLPPYYKDVPVKTLRTFPGWEIPADRDEQLFALGHPFYSSNPGLVALSTIWLREHNRVAALLQKSNPTWGDEQIFQTTRNILIVECLKITVEDYVGENLAKGEFKFRFIPTLLQGEVQYQNRIAIEFNHLYHWHEFIPEVYNISGDLFKNHEFLFRKDVLLKHTATGVLHSLSNQIAGEANGPNFDRFFGCDVARYVIEHGRGIRLQPLNKYRELVGLKPHKTFEDMTDDPKTIADLKEIYKHPDAVEMFPGMFIERRRQGGLFGETVTQRGVPSTFQGVFGHPLLSEEYWRPSTFGGSVGWDIVTGNNTLELLIRRNTRKWAGKQPPRGQMHTAEREKALKQKADL